MSEKPARIRIGLSTALRMVQQTDTKHQRLAARVAASDDPKAELEKLSAFDVRKVALKFGLYASDGNRYYRKDENVLRILEKIAEKRKAE